MLKLNNDYTYPEDFYHVTREMKTYISGRIKRISHCMINKTHTHAHTHTHIYIHTTHINISKYSNIL